MENLQRAGEGQYIMRIALVLGYDSGMIWGRLMLISIRELWMKAAGDTTIPCSDGSLFTLPDSEYSWTKTPVTLSLPLPDPLSSASGHVSACSPCPALPVLYRPPVKRSDSLLWSLSPVRTEGLHALVEGQHFSQLPPFPNQPWSNSCTQHAVKSQCWCWGTALRRSAILSVFLCEWLIFWARVVLQASRTASVPVPGSSTTQIVLCCSQNKENTLELLQYFSTSKTAESSPS